MSPKPHLITQKRSPTQSLPSPKDPAKSTPAQDSSTAQQQAASAAVQIITGLGAEPEQAEAPLALPISKLAGGAIIYRFAQLSPARDGPLLRAAPVAAPRKIVININGPAQSRGINEAARARAAGILFPRRVRNR